MALATKPNLWVCAYDIHYPEVDWKSFRAMCHFLEVNKANIAGFVFGGDMQSNTEISHHTKGKPLFRPTGSYAANTKGFDEKILKPIEGLLAKTVKRVYILGNHDNWEDQLVEEHPELQGTVERTKLLNIAERGWEIIPCGQRYKIGKLNVIHGEQLSGTGNQASAFHAKRAVDIYAGSVLYGHMHSPQSYTRVLPHDVTQKWQASCSPILGATNPAYLRHRGTAWLNGFTIVETQENGLFNMYPIVITNGSFSFGGKIYGGKIKS